jgi:S1-C subfamily serine protease
VIAFVLSATISAQQPTSWVSDETIASVARLGKIYDVYLVSGMPFDHQVTINYGQPDFGGGKVVSTERTYMDIGSGVVVTPNGWIVSNAHVADDWTQDSYYIQPVQDPQGNYLTSVAIPANPGYLWVSLPTLEDIKNNVRRISIRYLARTWYIDWDYWRYDRDRAICKIVAHAKVNPTTKIPEMLEEITPNDTFPYTEIRNPFDIPIREPTITSMGFPGIGPQTNVTISKGDFIGFEATERSHMMHTAFISGGNSGGGIFYRDRLIGINTWDRSDARGRNISLAQPITYYGQPFAAIRLWYEVYDLPEIPSEWIDADPSTDRYKDEVYVGFNVRSRVNEKVSLKNGVLVAYAKGVDLKDATGYVEFADYMNRYSAVQQYLRIGYDVASIAHYLQIDVSEVSTLAQMSEQDLQSSLSADDKQYYNQWKSGKFYSAYWRIDQNGQVLTALPPHEEFNITIQCNGYKDRTINFSTTREVVQGPWTVKVPPK